MAIAVEPTSKQGSRPSKSNMHTVSMARVMLGNSADAFGGCDEESFVKGYEKGFEAGWGFGFDQGFQEAKRQGRREAEAEFAEDANKAATAGVEEPEGAVVPAPAKNTIRRLQVRPLLSPDRGQSLPIRVPQGVPTRSSGGLCLLTDVAVASNPRKTSPTRDEDTGRCLLSDVVLADHLATSVPVKDEDVFFDARSSVPSSETEDDIHNASPLVAAAGPDSSEGTMPAPVPAPEANWPDDDLLGLFRDTRQHVSGASSELSSAAVVAPGAEDVFVDCLAPAPHGANDNGAISNNDLVISKPVGLGTTTSAQDIIPPLASPTPAPRNKRTTPNTNTATASKTETATNLKQVDDPTLNPVNTTPSTVATTLIDPTPNPVAVNTTTPTLIDQPDQPNQPSHPSPLPTHLYGIPLAHTITPITPDLHTPAWERLPRPPYPALAGSLNIYTLRAEGAKVVENPYCVVIGPVSAVAREAWKGDNGKGWVKSKLGGWGRQGQQGLALCEMVCGAEEGVWYLRAMFGTQEKARRAVEGFRAYPCGGSIMWAWISREEEH